MSTGQFAKRGFAPRFFCTANETTPLRTADTERNTLNPVVTERIVSLVCVVCWCQGLDECGACCVGSCDDYLVTQERQHASTALGNCIAGTSADIWLKYHDVHNASNCIQWGYAFRKSTLSGPVWRWWHAIQTAVVETRRKKATHTWTLLNSENCRNFQKVDYHSQRTCNWWHASCWHRDQRVDVSPTTMSISA